MGGLVFVLAALLPIVGFATGVMLSRRREGPSGQEKAELKRLRNFEAEALALAYEHTAYGDPLATKIIGLRRELK